MISSKNNVIKRNKLFSEDIFPHSLEVVNLIKEMLSFDERAFACELLEAHLLFSKEGE